ncbi:MAG: DJ-1/PfpI family protein [Minisyncoccia bacterium]
MKKKNLLFTIILAISLVGTVLWGIPLGIFNAKSPTSSMPSTSLSSTLTIQPNKTMEKKILMVVAFKNFKDEEYFVTKEVLEKAGFFIDTTSSQKGTALGTEGGDAYINLLPSEVYPRDYEAVVFVGGDGMAKELDNKDFQNLAHEFVDSNETVAAICVAPALLAKANLLKGVKATVWSSNLNKTFVKILQENGALYENKSVVQDGKIITANGPEAAQEFGEKIAEVLNK